MISTICSKCYTFKKKSIFLKVSSIYCKNFSSVPPNISKLEKRSPSYIHKVGQEPLLYRTLGQELSLAAERFGNRDCLVSMHEGIRYTFAEINEKVNQLASGFISLGLKKGDRLGIWSPNYSYWYISYLAAVRAGLILVAINPAYKADEITGCINKVGIKAIIAPGSFKTQNFYKILHKLAPELSSSEPGYLKTKKLPSLSTVIIAAEQYLPGAVRFTDIATLSDDESMNKLTDLQEAISPDDGSTVLYSSGTTGDPKAILLSHFSLVNSAHVGSRRLGFADKRHIICGTVPFFHIFGILGSICYTLVNGATLVLPAPHFNATDALLAIKKEKCTTLYGTPTMFVNIIDKQKDEDIPVTTLEKTFCGGAPCSPYLFKQMKDILHVKTVNSSYGMTETCGTIFQSLPGESISDALNTVGSIMDHTEMKVVDHDGNIVPTGTPGELWCRSYSNMKCYFNDDKKTSEILTREGWLKTGDKFILEENGYGRIVGRLKDVIIRGGENIYPKEIEDLLNTHPEILEAHVVGVSDIKYGEEVCVFARLRQNALLNSESLKKFCKEKISHFKIPKYVEFVDVLPTNPAGKVMKYKLKEIIEEKILKNKSQL